MDQIHEGQVQEPTDLLLLILVNRQHTDSQLQCWHDSNLTCACTLFSVATS